MADRSMDFDLIRQLAELLDKTSLTEIEVEDEGVRIRVARAAATVAAAPSVIHHTAPAPAPTASMAPAAAEIGASAPAATINAVRSPMVGTAYLSADPTSKPFVTPGERVEEGDTLVIIEAMKVMNQITAPRSGTVTSVLVQNAEPVEFGQPLVIIE